MNITDLKVEVGEHINLLESDGERKQLHLLRDALELLRDTTDDAIRNLGDSDDGDEFDDLDDEVAPLPGEDIDDGDDNGNDLGDGVEDD